jgi:hypothetical protein
MGVTAHKVLSGEDAREQCNTLGHPLRAVRALRKSAQPPNTAPSFAVSP